MKTANIKKNVIRFITHGLRRASTMSCEANRERILAEMMSKSDGSLLRMTAFSKIQRANNLRQTCRKLAVTHDIGNGIGQDITPTDSYNKTTI